MTASNPTSKQAKLNTALNTVNEELRNLMEANNKQMVTSSSFKFSPNASTSINIQTLKDVRVLIEILGFIQTKDKEYADSAKSLKLSSFPAFNWQGFTCAQWKHDISIRIVVLTNSERKLELEKLRTEISGLLDKETQTDNLLDKLTSVLGEDLKAIE